MTASAHSDLGGNIGIGFAIPASPARPVTDELRSNGRVTRGYPGVTIQPVSKDAPAAKAGLKSDDLITEYVGKQVAGPHELTRMVAQTKPGGEGRLRAG